MLQSSARFSSLLAIAVVCSLLGCGGTNEDEKGSENKSLLEKIVGNWKGKKVLDEEALQKWAKEEEIYEEDVDQIKKRADELTHYFNFKDDGSGRQARQFPDWTGFEDFKWELSKQEGDEARLTLSFEANGVTITEGYDVTLKEQDGVLIGKPIPDPERGPQPPNTHYRFERVEEIPNDTRVKEPPAKTVVK